MKRLLLALVLLICAAPLFAQPARTFVSNSGTDSGSCTLTAPCRTIPFAMGVVAGGGDIVVLNSGGYGSSFTINKAINIFVPDGVYAAVTTLAMPDTAIQIAAGATDVIRIEGLTILGISTSGGFGVAVGNCKRTELRKMNINRIGTGVKVTGDVRVMIDSLNISETSFGIHSVGSNTPLTINSPSAPPLRVSVQRTNIIGTAVGLKVEAGSIEFTVGNTIRHATINTYELYANVTTCSQVSINSNSDSQTFYNNNSNIVCGGSSPPGAGQVSNGGTGPDCRRGDIQAGTNGCNATP